MAHGAGLKVYTTLDFDLQRVANKAVLEGTATYERRHGWKGKLQNVLNGDVTLETYRHPDWTQPIKDGDYVHGLVLQATAGKIVVKMGSSQATMTPGDWAWTGRGKGDALVHVGDVGRAVNAGASWLAAEGAFELHAEAGSDDIAPVAGSVGHEANLVGGIAVIKSGDIDAAGAEGEGRF